MEKVERTMYVCVTERGKRMYIVAESKALNGKGTTVASYSLSDNLDDAAKCINKITAKTLIEDYTAAKDNRRTFLLQPIKATYEIEEDIRNG